MQRFDFTDETARQAPGTPFVGGVGVIDPDDNAVS
jgi:hypothetical protein